MFTPVFLLFTTCALFSAFQASAQDTIYKRNKEIIKAKIIEIGLDEIKYKIPGYENGATIVIAKDQIWKIIFANGVTQILQPEMDNPENYSSQKKNAVKVDFLAPMFRHFTFIYEHSLRPGQSIEASIGIIGVGFNIDKSLDQHGVFGRVGFKFIKSPDYYLRGMRYAHILKGSYIRPDILFGSYSESYKQYDYNNYNYNFGFGYYSSTYKIVTDHIIYGAIQLTFGKQFVFDDLFLVDYFVGLGYTFTNHSVSDNKESEMSHGVFGGSSSSPFSVSGGLRVGFLLK